MSEPFNGFSVSASGFAITPYALMDQFKDPKILAVYLWLHRHGFASSQGCWASVQTIADESGVGINGVRLAIKTLCQAGWVLKRERPGRSTAYFVRVDPPLQTTPDEIVTPHEIVRAPLTKSLDEQEPRNKNPEKNPLNPQADGSDRKGSFATAAIEIWNQSAPAHWVRIRELGQQRQRKLNGLLREFGTATKALDALAASLQQAHHEDWCMKASARLTLENWLSNGKVRQYQEKLAARHDIGSAEVSAEQAEMITTALNHPSLFSDAKINDGIVWLHYTPAVQSAARYPERAQVSTMEALRSEIDFLTGTMGEPTADTSPLLPF